MNYILSRPELALAAALVVILLWVGLAFWAKVEPVGDEVGERLDALQPTYQIKDLLILPAEADPLPVPIPRVSIYAQLCASLGYDPLGGPA